jgi:hypothetical protein
MGAGDGTRTHDILLGKQTLYQLSYTRGLYMRIIAPPDGAVHIAWRGYNRVDADT